MPANSGLVTPEGLGLPSRKLSKVVRGGLDRINMWLRNSKNRTYLPRFAAAQGFNSRTFETFQTVSEGSSRKLRASGVLTLGNSRREGHEKSRGC